MSEVKDFVVKLLYCLYYSHLAKHDAEGQAGLDQYCGSCMKCTIARHAVTAAIAFILAFMWPWFFAGLIAMLSYFERGYLGAFVNKMWKND